jgi:hypothetical protein
MSILSSENKDLINIQSKYELINEIKKIILNLKIKIE